MDVKCKEIIISLVKPRCEFCDAEFIQDPATFDTWVSSGQWPLVTLGFGGKRQKIRGKSDFETFYPTDVMETGYDLIFRWVPRMVIFGLYLAKEVPFRTVYLHGLVNDPHGKKMSKSKGNVISPIELTEKYGTDALRMALVVGNSPGSDLSLSEDKIRGYRNFATKIWNASRFVLTNKPISNFKFPISNDDPDLKELDDVKKEITNHIELFEFHLAAEKLYHYFWHTFADKIIEDSKPRRKSDDVKEKLAECVKLEIILVACLKMLHPFMPFITEEIYQKFMPDRLLMIEKW